MRTWSGELQVGSMAFQYLLKLSKEISFFDTGSGIFIVKNALAFRKDLRSIEKIFLSHGHDDHTRFKNDPYP